MAGGQGELQCFDLGLSPFRLQLVSEEDVIGTSGQSLQLARHVRIAGGLESVEWAHSPMSQVGFYLLFIYSFVSFKRPKYFFKKYNKLFMD